MWGGGTRCLRDPQAVLTLRAVPWSQKPHLPPRPCRLLKPLFGEECSVAEKKGEQIQVPAHVLP